MLATATRALRDSGSREIPTAALKVNVVGHFRRLMIAMMIGILGMTVLSQFLDLSSKSFVALVITQLVIAAVLALALGAILVRTLKGDPALHGRRSGLVVITAKGLRLFSTAASRRAPTPALHLDLDDLVFAHVEPRRSIFDLPRFVFGHIEGTMSYEIAGKDVLQLKHAIERLDESIDNC